MSIPMMASIAAKAQVVGGFLPATQRNYPPLGSPSLGTIVPVLEGDEIQLAPNGWMRLPAFGATSARPVFGSYALTPGALFMDTTIGKCVVFDGASWRDIQTGNVA